MFFGNCFWTKHLGAKYYCGDVQRDDAEEVKVSPRLASLRKKEKAARHAWLRKREKSLRGAVYNHGNRPILNHKIFGECSDDKVYTAVLISPCNLDFFPLKSTNPNQPPALFLFSLMRMKTQKRNETDSGKEQTDDEVCDITTLYADTCMLVLFLDVL